MEKDEKLRYAIMMFVSVMVYTLTVFHYDTGLASSLKDLIPWLDLIVYVLLGLVLLLIALDGIVAGMIPEKIVELLTWIYVLLLGLFIIIVSILNQLKL